MFNSDSFIFIVKIEFTFRCHDFAQVKPHHKQYFVYKRLYFYSKILSSYSPLPTWKIKAILRKHVKKII